MLLFALFFLASCSKHESKTLVGIYRLKLNEACRPLALGGETIWLKEDGTYVEKTTLTTAVASKENPAEFYDIPRRVHSTADGR